MIVLLDLEWTGAKTRHMTQLSAMRVDRNWKPMSRLDVLARPQNGDQVNLDGIEFGGYSKADYAQAETEATCVRRFADWLDADDQIWVWAGSNQEFLISLWKTYRAGMSIPAIYAAARKVRKSGRIIAGDGDTPYTLLELLGVAHPDVQHRASNDVEAMRLLFKELHLDESFLSGRKAKEPKSLPDLREKNRDIIDRTYYNYVYLLNSNVFHTRTCKLPLSAVGEIRGSVSYEKAACNRRPCKRCNPGPMLLMPKPKAPEKEVKPIYDSNPGHTKVKMIDGSVQWIREKNLVGWCSCHLHPGVVSKGLLKKHQCVEKQCYYLKKNQEAAYWSAMAEEQRLKEQRKAKAREEKEKQLEEEQLLLDRRDWMQDFLDDRDSDMYIVRIARENTSQFRIFYVSDNCYADGMNYAELYGMLRTEFPQEQYLFRHIKGTDGRFVTTEQYFSRPRK